MRSEWGTWANYDEARAMKEMGPVPDPLTLKNGQKVTDAATWWNQRRPEIVADAGPLQSVPGEYRTQLTAVLAGMVLQGTQPWRHA